MAGLRFDIGQMRTMALAIGLRPTASTFRDARVIRDGDRSGRGAHSDGSAFRFSRADDPDPLGLPRAPDGWHLARAGADLHHHDQVRKAEADPRRYPRAS